MRSCSFVSFRCLDPPLSCLVLFLPGPFSSGRGTRDEARASLPRGLAPRSLQVGEAARQRGAHQKSLLGNSLIQTKLCLKIRNATEQNRTEQNNGGGKEREGKRQVKRKIPWCMHFSVLPGRPGQTRLGGEGGEIFILFIYLFPFHFFLMFPFHLSFNLSLSLVSCLFLSFFSFLSHVPPGPGPGPAPARPCVFVFLSLSTIRGQAPWLPGSPNVYLPRVT